MRCGVLYVFLSVVRQAMKAWTPLPDATVNPSRLEAPPASLSELFPWIEFSDSNQIEIFLQLADIFHIELPIDKLQEDHSILLEDSLIALTPQQIEMFSQVEPSINPTCFCFSVHPCLPESTEIQCLVSCLICVRAGIHGVT